MRQPCLGYYTFAVSSVGVRLSRTPDLLLSFLPYFAENVPGCTPRIRRKEHAPRRRNADTAATETRPAAAYFWHIRGYRAHTDRFSAARCRRTCCRSRVARGQDVCNASHVHGRTRRTHLVYSFPCRHNSCRTTVSSAAAGDRPACSTGCTACTLRKHTARCCRNGSSATRRDLFWAARRGGVRPRSS